ncbi:protein phosphatase 2C domain-containing protein [Luteococcus sp. OSA5]|uniref:PP2C family protein-serine/threonine phosphatase n=1 Tax=Luteococcus sp. OSA5 TaxID=3401630 RepID=UPI003B434A4A
MVFSLDYRAHSEIGLVRKSNQDSAYASPRMLVVADGMGGAAAGDLASTVAIREILKSDSSRPLDQTHEVLSGALSRANHLLADLVQADPSLDGMGTTVTAALFTGQELGMVHIGDSRAYLLRGGVLHRLTSDHSWVQSLVDEGKISLAEAAVHPHRSLLLKVLNGQPTHEPDLETVELQLDDRLLFCSDGLCGFVPDATIREILQRNEDLDQAMTELVAAAHQGGGADNITVLLADVLPHDAALDARESTVVGAALDESVPDIEEHTLVGLETPIPADDPEPAASDERVLEKPDLAVLDEVESQRYAPKAARRRPFLAALAITAALAVLASAGLWGAWRYSRTQYFVGAQDQQVAVFRGVPGSVLGLELSEVTQTSKIQVDDLPTFYQQQVRTTIPVANLEAANETVGHLQKRADACRAQRAARAKAQASQPTPAASGTPTPGSTPGPTALLSPTPSSSGAVTTPSPAATNPAAPGDLMEDCR